MSCPVLVKKGDRIAQLICERIEMADLVEEEVRDSPSILFLQVIDLLLRNWTTLCVVPTVLEAVEESHTWPMVMAIEAISPFR